MARTYSPTSHRPNRRCIATLRIITAFATNGAEYYRSHSDRSMSPGWLCEGGASPARSSSSRSTRWICTTAQGGKALLTRRDQSVSIARAFNFPAKLVSHEHSSGNRSDTGSVSAELELKRRKSSQGLGDRPGLRIGSEFRATAIQTSPDRFLPISPQQ